MNKPENQEARPQRPASAVPVFLIRPDTSDPEWARKTAQAALKAIKEHFAKQQGKEVDHHE